MSSLTTNPTNITVNDTYQDIGLSVTLPTAGTYLVWAEIRAQLNVSSGTGQLIFMLKNTTDTVDISNSERYGPLTLLTNTGYDIGIRITELVTTSGSNKVIGIYGQRNSGPTYTTSRVISDSSGRSRIGYVKLS